VVLEKLATPGVIGSSVPWIETISQLDYDIVVRVNPQFASSRRKSSIYPVPEEIGNLITVEHD